MNTDIPRTARRFALTLAVAGIAALGSVAVAPAASAAGFVYTQDGDKVRIPTFCDPEKPNKQHNICVEWDAPRF